MLETKAKERATLTPQAHLRDGAVPDELAEAEFAVEPVAEVTG